MALRQLLSILGVLLVCFGAPARAAVPASSPIARGPEPSQEIVTIGTADGLQLAGLLTLPAGASAAGAPIVILLPDGPGGSPTKATEAARFLAQPLARGGFAVLSLETRLSTQYAFSRFDEAFADVKAALDLAASRGYTTAILGGSGLGSLLAARYAAGSDDGRVKALLLLGPSADLPAGWRAKVGEEVYTRTVERATKAAAENGATTFIDLGDGLVFSPAVFLDWYGPTAKTSLSATLSGVDKPVFFAAGAEDASAPAARLQRLAQEVPGKKEQVKTYLGAGHDLYRARDQLAVDIGAWLGENGLAPPPRVTISLVDTRAADGTALSGVLYAPVTSSSASRRMMFMLVPGLTGDAMRGLTNALGVRLAQRGFTALAVRTRSSGFRNALSGKLDDTSKDLAAWADVLAARGAVRIIGVGHGIGGLWLSVYLSQSQDRRFRGVAYLSPPRDLPALARKSMGDEAYERAVSEAEAAVKAGKGATTLMTVPFPQAVYEDNPRQPMVLAAPSSGSLNSYADAFLSYWGPDAQSVHSDRVAEMKIPIFAIGGSRDPMMQGGWLLQFIKAAGGLATSIFYGGPAGAGPSFDGFETRAADDVIGWAQRLP